MKIGDEVYIHGYIDEIRNNIIIICNEGGYFGTVKDEIEYINLYNKNCETCKHKNIGWWFDKCDSCYEDHNNYESF